YNDTAPTALYTLSLHDALPISAAGQEPSGGQAAEDLRYPQDGRLRPRTRGPHTSADQGRILPQPADRGRDRLDDDDPGIGREVRSEEHTSELQSRENLVCRLLL